MGLLISINGADFQPYQDVITPTPLVPRTRQTAKVLEVRRKSEEGESFDRALENSASFKAYEEAESFTRNNPRKAVYAKDIMTSSPITILPNETAETASDVMKKNQIRHLLVANKEDQILGVLSDRNLILIKRELLIQDIMSKDIIAAEPRTLLKEITEIMVKFKINSVPVLDEDKKVVGIITSSDIIGSVFKNSNIDLWV